MSVWEDLTVCDFLYIIDSWKLVGLGKMLFKAQTCWTDLLAFWGVWNRSRILNFSPDRLFFQFSRALYILYQTYSPPFLQTSISKLSMLWADPADDKLVILFLFFPENRLWHFVQIVSSDNLHEMQSWFSRENKKYISKWCLLKCSPSMQSFKD